MLHFLENYKGGLEVNGQQFENVASALEAFKDFSGKLTIKLTKPAMAPVVEERRNPQVPTVDENTIYRIKVRAYMTKPSSPEFAFHTQWNEDVPMPLRIMIGKKLKETKGMVMMELWGDILAEQTTHCMKCGKVLTNPVSKYFGIGPECGGHGYNNPFATKDELIAAVAEVKTQLQNIKWTGWIIKSAIEEEEVIEYERG